MKKRIFILPLFFCLLLCSCKTSEDEITPIAVVSEPIPDTHLDDNYKPLLTGAWTGYCEASPEKIIYLKISEDDFIVNELSFKWNVVSENPEQKTISIIYGKDDLSFSSEISLSENEYSFSYNDYQYELINESNYDVLYVDNENWENWFYLDTALNYRDGNPYGFYSITETLKIKPEYTDTLVQKLCSLTITYKLDNSKGQINIIEDAWQTDELKPISSKILTQNLYGYFNGTDFIFEHNLGGSLEFINGLECECFSHVAKIIDVSGTIFFE